MSMGKDRVRSVKWSNSHPSPPRAILTTARVGPYGYIHTIYIRRYGTRFTTLILWVSDLIESQTHRSHRPTGLLLHGTHQVPNPVTGLPGAKATDHLKPPNYWITENHHTRTCAGLIGLFPATIWLTIGVLKPPSTQVLHPWVTDLPFYHRATGSLDR
jgi:hypothetical protein